jgi:hypothetical protein
MNTATTIDVEVDLTFSDVYNASLRLVVYVLRYLIAAIAIVAVLWAICFLAARLSSSWSSSAMAFEGLLFPLFIGGFPTALILIPLVTLVRVKRMLRIEGTHVKRHYVFSEDGIKIESPLANADVKWAAYLQVRETGRYFLLCSAPGFANIIPKRCFMNAASVGEFRSLVRRHARKFKLRN